MYLKQWTDGSKPERSKRQPDQHKLNKKTSDNVVQEEPPQRVPMQFIPSSLETPFSSVESFSHQENIRESSHLRIAEREMVSQIGRNPFFSSSSYADNVGIQDRFLKPQSSVYVDRCKPTEYHKTMNSDKIV